MVAPATVGTVAESARKTVLRGPIHAPACRRDCSQLGGRELFLNSQGRSRSRRFDPNPSWPRPRRISHEENKYETR
jgi:hypothetical protein